MVVPVKKTFKIIMILITHLNSSTKKNQKSVEGHLYVPLEKKK